METVNTIMSFVLLSWFPHGLQCIDLSLESYICIKYLSEMTCNFKWMHILKDKKLPIVIKLRKTGITANFWVYGYSHFLQKYFPPQEKSIYYSFDQYNWVHHNQTSPFILILFGGQIKQLSSKLNCTLHCDWKINLLL